MTAVLIARQEDGVLTLLLNRPDRKNALTDELVVSLTEAVTRGVADPSVRLVVLRGMGREFCTGYDLDEFYRTAEAKEEDHRKRAGHLEALLRAVGQSPKPTVAVVQGRALGIGATLALVCDVVVASTTSTFGFPEITFGFVPALATVVLRRHVNDKVAFELVGTGRTIRADEARMLGLVSRVVPEEGFDAVTASTVRGLACCAVESFEAVKQLFRDLAGKSFEEGLRLAAEINAAAHRSPAFREAAQQFLQMT
jgi:enoyl-CoA hydratase/carnithine racemase